MENTGWEQPPGMGLETTMPHPQSSVLKNHQRLPRVRKRPQPAKMEEMLDGDRLLGLMEKYIRAGRHERGAALVEVAAGVALSFSSPAKRMRFGYLCEKEKARGRRERAGVAA